MWVLYILNIYNELIPSQGIDTWGGGHFAIFPPFRYFSNFSVLSKRTFSIEQDVYI